LIPSDKDNFRSASSTTIKKVKVKSGLKKHKGLKKFLKGAK
jgi:hypothetical protein